jgi:uncharacterized SAM-binding protein YcdF (DUF218 family)
LIILLSLWFSGFFYFLKNTQNISNYNRNTTDAIVVFGKNYQHLYAGVQLLKLGYAPLIFIIGDKSQDGFTEFFKQNSVIPEQFIFSVDIAGKNLNYATDTVIFLKKYQLNSIRLVISAPQLPRAMLELSSVMPSDVVIIPNPILNYTNRYDLILKEYLKYTVTLVAYYLGYAHTLNLSYA